MTPFEELVAKLQSAYPNAKIEIGEPVLPNGFWGIDFFSGENVAEVFWSIDKAFLLSVNSEACYGERPDEAFSSVDSIFNRIKELVDSNGKTQPPSLRTKRDGEGYPLPS